MDQVRLRIDPLLNEAPSAGQVLMSMKGSFELDRHLYKPQSSDNCAFLLKLVNTESHMYLHKTSRYLFVDYAKTLSL